MGNDSKSEMQIIRERLNLGKNVIVRPDEQENFYRLIFDDGFEYLAYSDNRFFYKKCRDYLKDIIDMHHKKYLDIISKYKNFSEYQYAADAGTLLIGDDNFAFHLSNGYGDGSFKFRVYYEDIDLGSANKGWKFDTIVEGSFYLFDYDCLGKEDRRAEIEAGQAVKLDGRYAIYRRDARCNFAFVRLSDAHI